MKIAAFDIETTSLRAMMGRILCASFFPVYNAEPNELRIAPKAYTLRGDKAPFRDPEDNINDTALCVALRDELEKYNMILTWNGKQFDVPFLNARLARAGERVFKPQFHLDLMYYAGGVSMRVGSRKLVNVQKYLGLATEKTDISWDQWQRAATLDRQAMNEVVEHCEADVVVLAQAYHKMLPFVANIHR